MKVRITVTVDINPWVWAFEYGLPADDKPAIREDVRTHLTEGVSEHLRALELGEVVR